MLTASRLSKYPTNRGLGFGEAWGREVESTSEAVAGRLSSTSNTLNSELQGSNTVLRSFRQKLNTLRARMLNEPVVQPVIFPPFDREILGFSLNTWYTVQTVQVGTTFVASSAAFFMEEPILQLGPLVTGNRLHGNSRLLIDGVDFMADANYPAAYPPYVLQGSNNAGNGIGGASVARAGVFSPTGNQITFTRQIIIRGFITGSANDAHIFTLGPDVGTLLLKP